MYFDARTDGRSHTINANLAKDFTADYCQFHDHLLAPAYHETDADVGVIRECWRRFMQKHEPEFSVEIRSIPVSVVDSGKVPLGGESPSFGPVRLAPPTPSTGGTAPRAGTAPASAPAPPSPA